MAGGITSTTYTDLTVQNGTTYFYEVTATDSSGTSGVSNEATVPLAIPSVLTVIAAPNLGKVQMGKTSALPQLVTLNNPGPSDVILSSFIFTTNTEFSINFDQSTCSQSGYLMAGTSCTLSVYFNPTYNLANAGPETDTLTITYLNPVNQMSTISTEVTGTSLILLKTTRLSQGNLACEEDDFLGNSTVNTIQDAGCALTAITELLNYTLGASETPCTMNTKAVGYNGFNSDNNIDWPVVTNAYSFNGHRALYLGKKFNSLTDPDGADEYLNSQLANGIPVIVGVNIGTTSNPTPGHFVIVTGQAINTDGTDTYSIDDPGHYDITLLSAYSDAYITRGTLQLLSPVVSPTPIPLNTHSRNSAQHLSSTDQTLIDMNVSTNADLLITDSNGNQTGFDPRTNQSFSSVVGSEYFADGNTDDSTGVLYPTVAHFIYIFGATTQTYTVSVIGNTSGPYSFRVVPFDSNGNLQNIFNVTGVASPGSVDQFNILPNGTITAVATPTPTPTNTPTPSPTTTPTPSQDAILTLTPDKVTYAAGNVAEISVAVNSSYVLPANSTLSIQALVNGVQDPAITTTSTTLFDVATPALNSGNTPVQISAILTTEPSALSGIDKEIANLKASADAASGAKRFWDEAGIVLLEVARGVVSIFQHTTTQTLEVDQINLIAN